MESRPLIQSNDDLKLNDQNQSPDPSIAAPPALPGITLGDKPLRRSQRAVLYRGWDRIHRRDVLVKVQAEDGDPDALARFRREAALMVRLRHPGIAAVYQFVDGDPPAAVTEYVSGRTLETLVRVHGFLDLKRAAQIIEEVAAALDCVHAQGIVHRGITPSSIVLPTSFFPLPLRPVKLTEFDVARVEDSNLEDLTPVYASPEQVGDGAAVEAPPSLSIPNISNDIYSLAAVAYFALTGKPPFQAADGSAEAQLSVRHRQAFAEPPPLRLSRPELTPEIEAVVLRGLAKAPEARYDSAGQLAADLRSAVEAAFSDPKQVALASASRRTGVLAGGLVGATALLLGAGLLWETGHSFSTSRPVPNAPSGPVASSVPPPDAVPVPPVINIPRAAKHPVLNSVPRIAQTRPKKTVPLIARAVPSEPKHLRHMPQLAALVPPAALLPIDASSIAAAPKPTEKGPGFLLIYANQNVAPIGQPEAIADVPAQSLSIDGKSIPVPPAGGWIALPAGRHWVSYYPDGLSKFGPRTDLPITVASGAHIRRQIVLPLAIDRPVILVADSPATVASEVVPVGWYTVSGWAAAPTPGQSQKPTLVRAAAQQIMVDGQPNAALALGQWAELPAGKHTIVFQPATGFGVGPKTWDITLDSSAHLNQQIPLPSIPVGWYVVSGWAATPSPDQPQKSSLVRAAASQIIVDGQPNSTLALGQWAELPAGKHTITFLPATGFGVGPKTWDIALDPLAHLNQQIPLPPVPVGWYTVSGWIAVPQLSQQSALIRTSAQQIMVDGQPNLTLALGQWAELPAGKHTITFLPTHGVNAALKTWDITLDPLAHLNQQIPLPPAGPLP